MADASMAGWFASGRVIDGIVVLMLVEAAVLIIVSRKLRRTLSLSELGANLAAGASLLMALRGALTGGTWTAIAAWLVVALLAHVVDLTLRWNRTTRAAGSHR